MAHVPLVCYAIQGESPVLSGMMLDNGLALLAAELLGAGHTPIIFDYNTVGAIEHIARNGKAHFLASIIGDLAAYVKKNEVNCLGVKLYANGFTDSVYIVHELKKRCPHLIVVAGGPQVGWFGESIFQYGKQVFGVDVFDALVPGEGDASVVAMANGRPPSEIPGAFFRDAEGKVQKNAPKEVCDLDSLPFPVYREDIYPAVKEKVGIPVLEDTRNCDWRKCTFCIHPRIGGSFRQKSVPMMVKEIEHNLKEYGMRFFRLGGPDPMPAYVTSVAKNIPAECKFSVFGRADGQGYDLELLASKLEGGIFIGLESADEQMLKSMLKTLDPPAYLANARRMIRAFKELGLPTVVSCIIPSANDTVSSMERTFDFLVETGPDFAPCLPMMPMPQTPLARRGESAGVKMVADYELQLMRYELDLLRPSSEWPLPPWKLKVDGVWVDNPFLINAEFKRRLAEHDLAPSSDEIVLMAALYKGSLSKNQTERRQECRAFNDLWRTAVQRRDYATIRQMMARLSGAVTL